MPNCPAHRAELLDRTMPDLAVLSQDIFTVRADRLPVTTSVVTMVGGKVVYDAGVLHSNP
jgi:hypothetical protein